MGLPKFSGELLEERCHTKLHEVLLLLRDLRFSKVSLHHMIRLNDKFALKPYVLRLQPGRNYCSVGRIAHEVGWKYRDTIAELEQKRKTRSAAFFERKKAMAKIKAQAVQNASKEFTTPL